MAMCRLDSALRFRPSMKFLFLPQEEKKKLIFPDSWDLSLLEDQGSGSSQESPKASEDFTHDVPSNPKETHINPNTNPITIGLTASNPEDSKDPQIDDIPVVTLSIGPHG